MGTAAWDDVSWGAVSWGGAAWNENADEWSSQTWEPLQSNEVLVDYQIYNIPAGFTEQKLGPTTRSGSHTSRPSNQGMTGDFGADCVGSLVNATVTTKGRTT